MNKICVNNDTKEFEYPYISIKVNGKLMDYSESVFSVAVRNEYNRISTLEMHLMNKMGMFGEVIVSETDIFTTDSSIEIWIG